MTTKPMLWIMYFFNFLDRNALVNAKLNSLEKDLGLKGTQYNTLISILFVGYIAGQIPSNMILNRVRPSWYLGGMFASYHKRDQADWHKASAWLGQLYASLPSRQTTLGVCLPVASCWV
jgi:hypothetical protein